MATKSLISINDLSNEQIIALCTSALHISENQQTFVEICQQKILALLFFEASTRTYFSFSSAMQRLGGSTLGFPHSDNTSTSKGESLEDTARMMAAYSDIMVVRHAEVGALKRIQAVTDIPIINGGEGIGEHPTQTLIDLFTIYKLLGRFDITLGLYGDLKFGRTNHSLMLAAARLGANFICAAPAELQMPQAYLDFAEQHHIQVTLTDDITAYADKIDVLYVSRLQKERLTANLNYESLKHQYCVDSALANSLKPSAIILHPLPRLSEINKEVDDNPRAKYFEQAANGVPMRMAILKYCLGV